MDLSLKQRLLGAAVLIALAVIFVPMFMSGSGPQKPATMETTTLAIPPAPDREFQTRDLSVAAPVKPADDNRITAVDTAAAPKPLDTTPTPEVAPTAPSSATIPEAAKPQPAKPEVAKPEAATPKPAANESARLEPGIAANGRYFVHLGVYSSGKNAADLVAALKKDGFAAYAEATDFQGKSAERVRVGPFADRAAAEAARLRIKQVKPSVPGSVVENATDAKADAPAAALPANRAGAFAVQLGALKTSEDANKLRDRLRSGGFAAFVDKVSSNGTTLWRVRAGPEVDRGAAEKLRGAIKEKLKLDGMIVTQ
jgi:DedD protein